ncbi:MAG TPA: DUF305 domain-containing protein [Gemmatimonadaceae bacterium]|nr:DUF305 domain-containing protein [Gemmatimonadaceae bacterium]
MKPFVLPLVAAATLLAATARAQQMGEDAAIARAQRDSARLPWTAADVQFMQGMIHHHAQAIDMCKWAPTHGASPSVQTLCGRIINAQGDEITLMSQWLKDRRQTVPDPTATAMPMTMNGQTMNMLMPGMLSPEQMKQLDAARGPAWDKLFLQDMIQHHRGAVSMVHDLFESQGAGQDETVFKFASDVNVDQTTEIARMEKMLFALSIEGNGQ